MAITMSELLSGLGASGDYERAALNRARAAVSVSQRSLDASAAGGISPQVQSAFAQRHARNQRVLARAQAALDAKIASSRRAPSMSPYDRPAPGPRPRQKVLSVEAYNRFVAEFGPNMAYDLNLTWTGAPGSFDKQRKTMIYREIARTPLLDLRAAPPEVTATRRYRDEDGDWEEDDRLIEISEARARQQEIVTGAAWRPKIEQGRARRTPCPECGFASDMGACRNRRCKLFGQPVVGKPFRFLPGSRPADLYPGTVVDSARSQFYEAGRAEIERREKARREGSRYEPRKGLVKHGKDWAPLTTSSQAAVLQAREMASRGVTQTKPKGWTSSPTTRPVATESKRQALRLKGLTKDSAAFRAMNNYQKIQYLTRIKGTFKGNRAFESMLARYTRKYNKEMLGSKEMIAAAMEKADPAWDIRQEQLRKRAAAAQARGWLDKVRHQGVATSTSLPGYDRIPHGSKLMRRPTTHRQTPRMTTKTPTGIAQGPSVSAKPWIDPRMRAPRPTTGGGVIYGQQARQPQQYSHGQMVAQTALPPMTYSAIDMRTK